MAYQADRHDIFRHPADPQYLRRQLRTCYHVHMAKCSGVRRSPRRPERFRDDVNTVSVLSAVGLSATEIADIYRVERGRRLTPDEVRSIRELHGVGYGGTELAALFKVSRNTISRVVNGRTHKRVK